MGWPPSPISSVLFLFCLGLSWEAHVPHHATIHHPSTIPSNATVFSHVYTIKLAGDLTEGEGPPSSPQEALGPPGSSQGGGLFEHTLDSPDQEHVVFTHRINLPPQACGCAPGTEDMRELLRRLQALENEVKTLRDTCQAGTGCCPAVANTQASTGKTDIHTLCSHHGSFDLSRCQCECDPGWDGPTCAEPTCPGDCGGPDRGKCTNGRCQCHPGYSGLRCEEPPSCLDDCNDQGRCIDGHCSCFPGYVGPSCSDPACPEDCRGHGKCVSGQCVCDLGYSGADCGSRACPSNCNRRGECHNGRCICEPGFTGPACGTKSCPNKCNQRGRCLKGGVCECYEGYTGSDCGQLACPGDCHGHGECQNGVCLCHDGYSGDDCSIEIPSIGIRVTNRDETSFRLEWNRPGVSVDGYEIYVVPTKDHQQGGSTRLPGTATVFDKTGLNPGKEYNVTIRAEIGQSYGPPATQTVHTRVGPPHGLQSSRVTENSMTLQWEPPNSSPDGYILSYVPLGVPRPIQATKRIELPATPEAFTLEDLESNTRYRVTLIAHWNGENSRSTSTVISTLVLAPRQPIHHFSTTTPPFHLTPGASSSEPGTWKPGAPPQPGITPSSSSSMLKEFLLKKMTQDMSEKLSSYNGTLLERLESYLRAIHFPLRGNQTIKTVARDIHAYLLRWKPKEFQVRVEERLVMETSHTFPQGEFPVGGAESVYSDGYVRPEHAKPSVVTSSSGSIEVSLDGVRGVSDNVVIRFQDIRNREGGEVVVPGDASTAVITGLTPGTVYQVEIHGVVKGHSSKSYSFITSTAPIVPTPAKIQPVPTTTLRPAKIQPVPTTTLRPEVSMKDLTVTDVSPNSLRVTWSAQPNSYRSFVLQYRDPKSSAVPGETRVTGTERSIDVVGLSPRTEYELQLHGEKPSGLYDSPLTAKVSTAAETQKPRLGDISILEVTETSARLSWNVATGNFDSFLIQYKDADGKSKSVPASGNSREATVSELVPSRKYKFNLYGLVGRKRFGPVSTEAVTAKPDRRLTAPPSLGELSAYDITSDSVRLSWSVPSGSFDSFVVQYKDTEGRPQVLPVEGNTREVSIPSLAPSRKYRFNLYGITSRKRLGPATTDITTAAAAPETGPKPVLGDLSVYETTSDSVRLAWSVSEGHFDSFLLQYQDPEGNEQTLSVNQDSQEASVSNLAPSQTYRFNLYGISGDQRLGPISTDAITAHKTASRETTQEKPVESILSQPTLGELSVSDVTSNSVHLSWTVPSGTFDSFLVQYKDSTGKTQMQPINGSSHETVISNLTPSHRYKFNLYGVSGRKRSNPVSLDATTTASQETDEPTEIQPRLGELSVSDVTRDSVHLSWTVPIGDFDSFLVQYKDAEGKPQALPVRGDSREVPVPNLAPSHRYRFNLYGVSGRKRLGPLSTDATTASQEVEEPVSVQPSLGELSVSDVTGDTVCLVWTVRTGNFDSFLVQYKDANGKTQALPVEGSSHKVLVSGLSPSRRYKFNLFGVSGRKRSGPLSTETTTASAVASREGENEAAVQPSLGELSVSDVSANSIHLSWTVRSGNFDSFLVQYKDADGKLQNLPVERDFRDVIVPNLIPSRRYKFNLYGVSGRKRSAPISVDATTGPALSESPKELDVLTPTQPRLGELSAFNISSNSLHLSWTVPTGTFDSFLVQYKDAEGKLQAVPVDGGATHEVTISNLVPSRRYKFNFYGISGLKRVGPVSIESVTAPLMEKPTSPVRLGELTAANAMPDSLDLSWTVEEGNFDSFIIQYRDAQGKPQALPVDGNLRSLHLHDLAPSHRYKLNLYGILGRKRLGPISTEAETAPSPTTPPPQPTLGELSASNIASDSVRLSWTVFTGSFNSFLVQYKDVEGKPQSLPVDGESREVSVPSLVPSQRYKFNLYGVSGGKHIGPVSVDTVTGSLPEEPPSLGELFASDITSDSVRLSWTLHTGDFDTFVIQYKDAQGKPRSIPVEGAFRQTTVSDLAPSRRYKFNLYGIMGRKRIGPISTDAITASPPAENIALPTLGQLSVSDVTTDSAHLSWTVQTGNFDSFSIQYKDAEGKTQALPFEGRTRETTITGLSPSRRYKFNLFGFIGRKRLGPVSADTVTASTTTKEEVVDPSFGELSVSEVTSHSALLSWTVTMGNFDSFLIQYKDAEGKPQALPVEGSSRLVTVSDLTPSHKYKFNLYGITNRKRLGPISSEATTVKPEEDEQEGKETEEEQKNGRHKPRLGELLVSEAKSSSVRLSWSVPTGSFDSFLVQYENGEDDQQSLPVDGASREVTVSNLIPSQRYRFDLYGISDDEHFGPVSINIVTAPAAQKQKVRATTTSLPEPRLGELSVSDVTGDTVRLSWDIPTGTYDSFLVQYMDAEDNPQEIPVDKETNSIVIYYLVPSYRYTFYLYGVSGRRRLGPISTSVVTATAGGEEGQEDEEAKKEAPAQTEPRLGDLSVSEATSNSARLSWTVPVGSFDSFSVHYKDAEGRSQALPIDGDSLEVIVPNLAPSHKYRFNLYGISGQLRLGPISANAVTTGDEEPPKAGHTADKAIPDETEPLLGKLSVSETTSNAVHLSWTVPVGSFDSFSIQYKDAEGRPQALPVGGNSRDTVVPNLNPSHKYRFNVYGISGQQRLGPISTNAVTTASTGGEKQQDVREEVEEKAPSRPEPHLGELSVSEVTSNAVHLSWTVPVGSFDSFSVQYKDAEGRPQALPVGGNSRDAVVPNLNPSHKYRFNVYGISGQQRLGPISTNAVTTASTGDEKQQDVREEAEEKAPSTPEPHLGELSVSEVTSNAVHLSWTVPVGSFDSFSVQYKDAEGRPQALPVGGHSRDAVVPNLNPSHKYRFNVYGISGQQRLGPISTNAVTTASTGGEKQQGVREEAEEKAPSTPEPHLGELSVSEVTSNAVYLSWTVPVGSFDSFSVQYKDAEGRPQALPVGGDSRDAVVPNLNPSHKYRFNVYGISGQQRLGPISTNAVTTASTGGEKQQDVREEAEEKAPSRPEPRLGELSVSEVASNAVHLSWTVPVGSFDSFSIQYKDAGRKPQSLPVEGDSREAMVPGLVPSHKYRFNLYGISGKQRFGPISANAVTTAAETSGQPVVEMEPKEAGKSILPSLGDLTVSEVTPDSLLLSWSIPEGSFDSFLIQYKDATGKDQILPVDGAMRSLHLYNLVPSQRYEFNVFGISGNKRLGPVSIDAVTAPEAAVQPQLGELSVSKVTSDSISLSWSVPAGTFDSFLVQYRDTEGKPQVLPLSGDAREVTIPNLASSHRYKFNLYGLSGPKRLGPVSTDAVTGPGTQPEKKAPLKLGELSAQDITAESLLLSWTVDLGNFDSFVIQYRDADGKPHALPVDGSLRSLRLHDLVPSHRYRFNLYGLFGRKRFGPISTEAVTAALERVAPPQPNLGEFSASGINSTSVRLSWIILTGIFDSFIIQYRDAEGKPQALPVDRNALNFLISNLVPSHKYKFNLYGISGRKRFGPISVEAVTAQAREPEIHPTLGDLSISEVTQDSVRLSWTISAGKFDSFLIQYKDAEGRSQSIPVDSDTRTVVISDLIPSHRYKFNFYGISGRKRIGPVSTDAVTAFPDAQSKPSAILLAHLVVSDVTPTSLQLTWEVPEGEVDTFLVRGKESLLGSGRSPPPAKEVTVTGDERSVTLRGLIPNTEYSLTVYGIKDGSEVANINTGARTSGLGLDSPRDLRFSDIRETSVVANWRPPTSRIDRYKITIQPSDGGESRSISVDGTKVRTTIENLTPGASYEVTAVSIRGSEESEPLVGYVTTVPDGPSDFHAIDVTDSSAVLTWHPPLAEMNNYIVTYGPIGGSRVSESVPGNRVQLPLSGLHRDTEYRASIYGEKEGNRSSPISATFTTGADGPRDLRASEISARSARLTWSPPQAPPGGYLLSYETPSGQSKEIPVDASVTSYELQDLIPSSRYQVQVQALRRGTPTAPTSTSFTTEHLSYPFPRDCAEESMNGAGPSRVTTIYLGGNRDRPLQVYCDMETDGGGWIVFQRRMNGETDFWRDWQDYATGFGNLTREFWLGNDALHQLTFSGDYELRVDLRAGNQSVYAKYQGFRVDPPADYYRLHLGSYSGTAGDSFSYHSGSVFSTRDRDPNRLIIPCAVSYRGAWWYRNCHYANLNGLYGNNRDHQGINWFNWKGFEFSVPFTEMKTRPRGFQPLRRA